MNFKKKISIIIFAWSCEDWIDASISHASEISEKIFVLFGAHSENIEKISDNTLLKLKKWEKNKNIKLIKWDWKNSKIKKHANVKASGLNYVLRNFNFHKNDLIWILDTDEFYPKKLLKKVSLLFNNLNWDTLVFDTDTYFIDDKYCFRNFNERIFRLSWYNLIPFDRFQFTPTQNLFKLNKISIEIKSSYPMQHFCFLTNPNLRYAQWKDEYISKNQEEKLQWFKKIYLNYSHNHSLDFVSRVLKIWGIKSIYLFPGMSVKKDGTLFLPRSKTHPLAKKVIDQIKDVRRKFNLKIF